MSTGPDQLFLGQRRRKTLHEIKTFIFLSLERNLQVLI